MHIYIIIGPSGIGKTTIGKMLSEHLDIPFFDADDFHSESSITKMSNGTPLDDNDRKPWLDILAENIRRWHGEHGAVLACSALKEKYRQALVSIPEKDITWIYLYGDLRLVSRRLSTREEHFFDSQLLESQYHDLEVPQYGLHIEVDKPPKVILEEILSHIRPGKGGAFSKSELGLVGLGVMGKSLAFNIAEKQIPLSVYNRHVPGKEEKVAETFIAAHEQFTRLAGFDDIQLFLDSLQSPRNIMLMVNAGEAVDKVIGLLLPYLDEGDLIIDGGNSHYKDTIRREAYLRESGIYFLGVGISGGEEGARKGPSIMPGGSAEAYRRVGKYLETIAARDKNGNPCCTYVGPGGAGHFVKMVHNGIEYAEMQIVAEIYQLCRYYGDVHPENVARLFQSWQQQGHGSFILEITIEILQTTTDSGELLLDKILDAARQKNTGSWTVQEALQLGVPVDTISAAVLTRLLSSRKGERMQAMESYRGITWKAEQEDPKLFSKRMFHAYAAARIVNHAIGFELLKEASAAYHWDIDLSEIARIWTNGCIIRSALMEKAVELLQSCEPLLRHERIIGEMKQYVPDLVHIIAAGMQAGYALPVLSSAANYFLGYTTGYSPANLIQAQRDFFGAHTYQRVDKPMDEHFHTHWNK